jgi:hypothetical protein
MPIIVPAGMTRPLTASWNRAIAALDKLYRWAVEERARWAEPVHLSRRLAAASFRPWPHNHGPGA